MNDCQKDMTYDDVNFKNERFFHYDNTDKLIPSDPVHVPREVLNAALMGKDEIDGVFLGNEEVVDDMYFGDAKKKRQL